MWLYIHVYVYKQAFRLYKQSKYIHNTSSWQHKQKNIDLDWELLSIFQVGRIVSPVVFFADFSISKRREKSCEKKATLPPSRRRPRRCWSYQHLRCFLHFCSQDQVNPQTKKTQHWKKRTYISYMLNVKCLIILLLRVMFHGNFLAFLSWVFF